MEQILGKHRVFKLNNIEYNKGHVLYWMSRDQRVDDNWAMIYAQNFAQKHNVNLAVCFCLVDNFPGANNRHYRFMLDGLKKTLKKLNSLGIPFIVKKGIPSEIIPNIVKELSVGKLVTDFDPLRIKKDWKEQVNSKLNIPFEEVDAHNIIPCRILSVKEEYAAYTLRPKINKALEMYLEDFPKITKQEKQTINFETDREEIEKSLSFDFSVKPVEWLQPGEDEALEMLNTFIHDKLPKYSNERNNPIADVNSNLSPYLHFGHISAQRVALEVRKQAHDDDNSRAFFEELIVRKELSDNYCFYNENYDNFAGFPSWARKSLDEHRNDKREFVYSFDEFETAGTHDKLWNAAQLEMVNTGKMHGYMRMYWAKKILEWSESPEEAQKTAIYLNDKYELDGRDPNGFTGIAWSIGGVHDRPWFEREIFGKIRYMAESGCRKKFNVDTYIKKHLNSEY